MTLFCVNVFYVNSLTLSIVENHTIADPKTIHYIFCFRFDVFSSNKDISLTVTSNETIFLGNAESLRGKNEALVCLQISVVGKRTFTLTNLAVRMS